MQPPDIDVLYVMSVVNELKARVANLEKALVKHAQKDVHDSYRVGSDPHPPKCCCAECLNNEERE